MNNTNEKIRNEKNQNEEDVKIEKSAIVALIILTLVLVYFSLFFIHNIIDIGSASSSQNVNMNGADNNVTNNTNITNNTNETRNNTNWVNGVPVNQAGNNTTGNNAPGANTLENNVPGNTTPGNNVPSSNNTANETPIVDNSARIQIFEGSKEWKDLKELGVFENGNYQHAAKIAPGVSGSYNFTVENHRDSTMKYDIWYGEVNTYNINMKFKLKRNGSYIAGDENTYVSASDLAKTDFLIDANKVDLYTIEWKWLDSDNDTEVGMTEGANYKLCINTYAEEVK